MKAALTLVIAFCATSLAGCTSTLAGKETRTELSRQFDARVIDCALPYLGKNDMPGADIHYRYSNGSVIFTTQHAGLTTHLHDCATPDTGPRAEFEGTIEIWPASTI